MNISRKCMKIWNKFKKVGGKYLKTLLVLVGVACALFAGHELDAGAEEGEKGIRISVSEVGHLVNISPDKDDYAPFNVTFSREGITSGQSVGLPMDLTGPHMSGLRYYFRAEEMGVKPAYEYGDAFHVRLNNGYDAARGNEPFNEWTHLIGEDDYLGTALPYIDGFVGKRPSVIIVDNNYDDVSGAFNISSTFTFVKDGDSYKYRCDSINIKAKEGSSEPSWVLDEDVLDIYSGADSYTRNADTGDVTLTNYTGNTDVVFRLNTKKIYIGSKNDDERWKNEDLANAYDLEILQTTGPDDYDRSYLEVRHSDDFNKGAWQIEYIPYERGYGVFPPISWTLQMNAKSLYAFENPTVSDNMEAARIAQEADQWHVPFIVIYNKNMAQDPRALEVKVGGQEYRQFTNTFKYSGDKKLNTFIQKPQYQSGSSSWTNIGGWAADSNVGTDVWTIADPYRVAGDESSKTFSSTYRFEANPGYYVGDATVKFDSDAEQSVEYSSDTASFTVSDKTIDNHTITINNVKKHYDVTFKPQDDFAKVDMMVNGSALSDTGVNVTDNIALDQDFKVTLDLVNDRKTFKNADDVKDAIIAANSELGDLKCTKDSDTKVTLTVPHKTESETIIIPDNLFNWKKANADFSIDPGDVDKRYREEALQSIELHKGNGDQGEIISLKEGSNSTLVNIDTQTNVSYDGLTYTLSLNDSTYFDLTNAKVEIEGGLKDEAVRVSQGSDKTKFVFKLDPNCAGAPHRSSLKFKISGIETNLIPVQFTLCPKANLYLIKSDGSEYNIANAPSDSPTAVDVGVPDDGAKYLVMYTDYSKEFKEENIQGSNVEINNRKTESFNRLSFEVVPGSGEPRTVILKDPAKTAPPVKFTPVEGIKYYGVKGGAIDHDSPIQGTVNIPYGETYLFAVECNEGYDPETLELKANDNVFGEAEGFTKNGNIFTIDGSKAIYPITITGNVHATQQKIIFKKDLGGNFGRCDYIYNGASVDNVTVLYGQGIAFEVTLPGNCNQSEIVVKFNGESINKVNGKYVLNNITSDGEITVSNVSMNKYPVTFMPNSRAQYKTKDGKNLSGTQEVEHGKSYEFRVEANSGYTMGKDSIVYVKYADGRTATLKPNNDVYKINNIQQACTVSIENVEDIVYTITLIPADGVTYRNDVDNVIKDSIKIKHGRNFEFSVLLSDEYDDSLGGMNIIVNDGRSSQSSAQKLASGRYVIPNVSEDITIKVGNVRKNTYTVSLIGAEGIDYYDSSGKIITGDNQAEHHSDFSFKVELYPAYACSDITVMLGDKPMSADSNGFYTIPKISESKTVTVVGIEQSDSSELVNRINNLPDSLGDLSDVDDVIEATKTYESLSDAEKALIGNADKLRALQEQAKEFHHVSNDVRISGVDWYIKLYAIPITEDTDACGRIYKKLGSEYILSLYNVYLWNTLTDTRYTLPEGQSAVVTLPTPDMKYFEKPTAIHEKDNGKLEFINASINSDITTFQTDSFSPMGIVANRSSTPGRSSLLDAADANLDAISNFAASVFGNDTNKVTRSGSDRDNYNDIGVDSNNDETQGNIDEKFRSRNNRTTAVSSALRLALVLMILILIGLMIYFFIKNRKDKKKSGKE